MFIVNRKIIALFVIIIIFIIVSLFLLWYWKTVNKDNDFNLNQDNFENITYQKVDINKLSIFKPKYDELAVPSSDEYLNKIVQLKGKISNLSQVSGIKFWPYDEKYISGQRSDKEFFWVNPEDLVDITDDEHQGLWVRYILKRYAGLSPKDINYEDIYLVTGKYTGSDCDYWQLESGEKYCIPQIDILDIRIWKKNEQSNVLSELGKKIQEANYPNGGFDLGVVRRLDMVYINTEPFLYYNLIDGGTGIATVIHGLIGGDNQVYWIEFSGKYAGLENGLDTIMGEKEMSQNLEENSEIYKVLLEKSSILSDGRIPLLSD